MIADEEVLVESFACFHATDYTQSTIFSTSRDGILKGVRLDYLGGAIGCQYDSLGQSTYHGDYFKPPPETTGGLIHDKSAMITVCGTSIKWFNN